MLETQVTAAAAPPQGASTLLELRDVRRTYHSGRMFSVGRRATVVAVDGISLSLAERETLGVVGESGSGKSTTARMLLGLEAPNQGSVLFQGREVKRLRGDSWRTFRAGVQAVFQDPWSSLNPRRKVGQSIEEPLITLTSMSAATRSARVGELLDLVGLRAWVIDAYPHELSGGMRQRVSVARAIASSPSCVVLDEPVSALDVSIKAQVMNLLKDLQEKLNIAFVLIAHDLATVRFLSDRIVVMYAGRIVESAPTERLFAAPAHPYTQQLFAASVPGLIGPDLDSVDVSAGDLPCPRCGRPVTGCLAAGRGFVQVEAGHLVACASATEGGAHAERNS
jgi:ABC-type glutathione transport system ATPase component